MYKYELIIYWSNADQKFIAEAPELPGCMSDGNSPQDAITNIQVVIDEWIKTAKKLGRKIPRPKGRRLIYA